MAKRGRNTTVAKQSKRQKPYLAAISETRKIRDYSDIEIEKNNAALIQGLKAMLGVPMDDDEDKQMHTLAVDHYITNNLKSVTYEEIREAFSMALKGDFQSMNEWGGYKIFPKLDCILLSKVMNCFKVVKRIRLKQYKDKQRRERAKLSAPKVTDEEKRNSVKRIVRKLNDNYKKNGSVPFGYSFVFDMLNKSGLIDESYEYRKKVWNRAKRYKDERKGTGAVSALINIENKKHELKSDRNSYLRTVSKKIAMEDFFKDERKTENIIKDLYARDK